ncbi:hypothetical protein ACRRTK_021181 [Alexandromys fortis]
MLKWKPLFWLLVQRFLDHHSREGVEGACVGPLQILAGQEAESAARAGGQYNLQRHTRRELLPPARPHVFQMSQSSSGGTKHHRRHETWE